MSEQKRYTALDYKVTAESCEKLSKSFLCGDKHDRSNYADMAAMLRQAADAEEELDKLRKATNVTVYFDGAKVNMALARQRDEFAARLESVVKECEKQYWAEVWNENACEEHNKSVDAILRAARGDGGAE